ncbi:hypothetical protein [Spirosoma panaciterrae]|uniref:hypothetical protein n=1 Tax=Spirosoma panaciterrae TaxID=496058 RepID=UPI0003A0D2CC|nr:hypothetical protein [Spirosoma panaciterrae]
METSDFEKDLMPPVLSALEFEQLLGRYKRAVYTNWLYPSFEHDPFPLPCFEMTMNQSYTT